MNKLLESFSGEKHTHTQKYKHTRKYCIRMVMAYFIADFKFGSHDWWKKRDDGAHSRWSGGGRVELESGGRDRARQLPLQQYFVCSILKSNTEIINRIHLTFHSIHFTFQSVEMFRTPKRVHGAVCVVWWTLNYLSMVLSGLWHPSILCVGIFFLATLAE